MTTAYTSQNTFFHEDEAQAAYDVAISGATGGNAARVEEYEANLAAFFSRRFAVACSSGTAGLYMAMYAAGVGPDSEVVVSPAAPVMTALPILALGARPVFADLRSTETFSFDPCDVLACCSPSTRAVIAAPMWGYPADSSATFSLAKDRGITTIEDCSHAHGTAVAGQHQGSSADIAVYSTQEKKLISTGEGGFLLTNSADLCRRLHLVRNCGKEKSTPGSQSSSVFGASFGLNFRLSSILAAIGIIQLQNLDRRLEIRRKNAERISRIVSHIAPTLREFPANDGVPNYYNFLLFTDTANGRDLNEILLSFSISSDIISYNYKPLYAFPVFSPYARRCANAESISECLATLPTHESLDDNYFTQLETALNIFATA